jgi:hypothetical protein
MVVPTDPESGTPSPCPINRVLLGNIQVNGMVIVPAGSKIVDEGSGAESPVQGLGIVELHVKVADVFPGIPRASITAPPGG